ATIEQASDETEDFAIAAAESETPVSDLSDNVSAQTEVHGQEEVAAEEPASFDEATSESEEEAGAAVNEEVASPVEEADATPTHAAEHDTDEVPMMGSTAENAESTMFDVAASDDEPTSEEEIAPAAESLPMRTMQLDSDVISQSIEASREEIFSIETDAEPPSPSGESESEKDDFFLIDSDDESESEPKAESPSEDVFAIESDEPPTTPGEWPLAGPIDEQVEPISDEEAAEESIAFATEAAYRTPAADAAETVEESAPAEEESATPQVLDDRDMIVVEEPQEDVVAEEDLPRARRQEYRQLFARLRKSQ
ncbi:MAG: hypothetical protein NXI22_21765, partial [bacterium]|nr:hypothetical protein [bacterium]